METIKVKMNVSIASADWSFIPGQEVELDLPLAEAWVDCGHASKINGAKVDKGELVQGVEYIGFGRYAVSGQTVYGKKEALEALKAIPQDVKDAHKAKLEEEAAKLNEAAALEEQRKSADELRLKSEKAGGDKVDPNGKNAANNGTNNSSGS